MMVVPLIEEVCGIGDLYDPDRCFFQNAYPARNIQDFGDVLVNGETILNEAQCVDIQSAIRESF